MTIFGKSDAGDSPAEQAFTSGGVPAYEPCGADDISEGMLAGWQPKHPKHPNGAVLINIDHPVLRSVIEYWQSQYADHYADQIEKDVISVYGQIAVSKVAHSEHLKGLLTSQVIERELRSDGALTMSLLGLVAEDHLIATRIGGKYSKKRQSVVGAGRRAK